MSVIPVDTATALLILNLPNDLEQKQIFDEYKPLILSQIEKISDEDVYSAILDDSADVQTKTRYKFAYCYLLFSNTVEFLNLKTLGERIIKSTGIDGQSAEILSGSEIQSIKKSMEIKALETILEHLNFELFLQQLLLLPDESFLLLQVRSSLID
jgi:hypothetical protein